MTITRSPLIILSSPAGKMCIRDSNYYMQLAEYIRRYKGTAPRVNVGDMQTVDVAGSFDPVSYTHLDVYKRQDQDSARRALG